MKQAIRPEIESLWCSVVDGGMQLELSTIIGNVRHPLLTVVAEDADESLWVEVYSGEVPVRIPLEAVRDALQAAVGQVHSETWYDKNLPAE